MRNNTIPPNCKPETFGGWRPFWILLCVCVLTNNAYYKVSLNATVWNTQANVKFNLLLRMFTDLVIFIGNTIGIKIIYIF